MTPPVVRWVAQGDRWIAFHVTRFPIAIGMIALVLLPFAYVGVFALRGLADQPTPWWRTALGLLFATALLAVPIMIGYRALLTARRTYWLMLNELGLHLSSGRHSGPILTVRPGQLERTSLAPDADGSPVLLLALRPRPRPSELDGEVAEAGRTVLLRDGMADGPWDLGFVLERRSGDPRMLQAAVEQRLLARQA